MKEASWDDCLINKSEKTITPDPNRPELLAENAKKKDILQNQKQLLQKQKYL